MVHRRLISLFSYRQLFGISRKHQRPARFSPRLTLYNSRQAKIASSASTVTDSSLVCCPDKFPAGPSLVPKRSRRRSSSRHGRPGVAAGFPAARRPVTRGAFNMDVSSLLPCFQRPKDLNSACHLAAPIIEAAPHTSIAISRGSLLHQGSHPLHDGLLTSFAISSAELFWKAV